MPSRKQLFHAMMNDPEARAGFYAAQTDEARVALLVRAGEKNGLAVGEEVARASLGLRRAADVARERVGQPGPGCEAGRGGSHEAR